MKKTFTVIATMAASLLVIATMGAGSLIRASAKGRTYSDVTLIPARKTAVVLGCSHQLSNGRGNLFFAYRVAAAATLFKAGKVRYLIVSGDNHVAGYDEATDMKHALVDAGVPEDRIYCDFAGFRTLDSIVRAKEVFGQTNITVVSQEFHNQRALYIARHREVDAIGFNARDVDAYHSFRTTLREQFARVKTVLDMSMLRAHPRFLGPRIDIGVSARPSPGAGAETSVGET